MQTARTTSGIDPWELSTWDAVETADPFRCLFNFLLGDAFDLRLDGNAPGVVGLVVKDEYVPRARHVAEQVADIGFRALGTTLVDAAPSLDLLCRLPVERMPVAHENLALAQRLEPGIFDEIRKLGVE